MAIFPGSAIPSAAADDFTIDQSLRFEDGDSAYLSRTPSVASNRKTWSLSFWRKQESGSNTEPVLTCGSWSGGLTSVYFNAGGALSVIEYSSSSYNVQVYTDAKYRDPSAWSHYLVVFDSSNATSTDRVRMYKDGVRETIDPTRDTMPSQDFEGNINTAALHMVGRDGSASSDYGRGYLAEMHFLDGTALTDASSFGEEDSTTGQWKPIEVTGMDYGVNGFYQKYNQTALANSFTGSSAFSDLTFTPSTSLSVDYLIVGGGGGGSTGNNYNGGGGAGGYRTGTGVSVTAQDYTIVVGSGGSGSTGYPTGDPVTNAGSDSSALGYSATGGGGTSDATATTPGGSGGGGYGGGHGRSGGSGNEGSYSPVEGYDGGSGGGPNNGGGGGGGGSAGVGTAGNDGRNNASGTGNGAGGDGGAGTSTDFNGTSTYYAAGAGGAGGWVDNTGGGHAAGQGAHGSDGTGYSSTGYGMGGGRNSSGGAGTNGVVMIKYANASAQATGGIITSYEDSGTTYQVHTFTAAHSAHTITANGDAANQRPQPKGLEAAQSACMIGPKLGTSMVSFDGTGDYLTAPDSSDWDVFGSSSDNWTIDFFIRHKDHAGSETYLSQSEDSSNYWQLAHYHSGGLWFGVKSGGSWIIDSTGGGYGPEITDTDWHHVALCKVGQEYGIYLDGSQGTYTSDSSTDTFAAVLAIGTSTWDGTNRDLDGYMGEIRVQNSNVFSAAPVVGKTDTITVPTSTLTSDSDTKLLIQSGTDGSQTFTDSSSNSHTITANGGVRWFAPKIGAGAMAFDGSGDWVQTSSSPDFAFGTGDFTVEGWVKFRDMEDASAYYTGLFGNVTSTGSGYAGNWGARQDPDTDTMRWYYGDGTSYTFSWSPSDHTWYHVAFARSGTDLKFFVNGTQVGATQSDSTSYTSQENTVIGSYVDDNDLNGNLNGYLDEVRVSRVCRYTTTFTPSTTEFTDDINTVLLIHGDQKEGAAFQDSSTGLAISETSRMSFDGTGDYLSVPASSDFDVGTNFTAECWFQYGGDDEGGIMGTQNSSGYSGWFFRITNTTDTLDFNNYGSSGGAEAQVTSGTLGWGVGQWYHLAIVKDGNDYEIFRDGVSVATATDASSLSSGGALFIGKDYASDETICKMDEIRISNSARYTSNFTPKARGEQFTADANTMLLIHSDWEGGLGADSSGNYNNFTATNLVATDVVKDSPTNNFATLNPVYRDGPDLQVYVAYAQGNLSLTGTSGNFGVAYGTIPVPDSGKWYWEAYLDDGDVCGVGIVTASGRDSVNAGWGMGAVTTAQGFTTQDTYVRNSESNTLTLGTGTPSNGDIYQLAIDVDNNKVWIGLNNTWNDSSGGTTGNPGSGSNHTIALTFGSNAQIGFQRTSSSPNTGMVVNFGADSSFVGNKTAQSNADDNGVGDFFYSPPSGFLALCSENLPSPSIADPAVHMNTVLYTGNGGTQSVTGAGFAPDLVWIKNRDDAVNHGLFDTIRGVKNSLQSNTSTEARTAAGATEDLYAFGTDGFSVGVDTGGTSYINCNESSKNYASWNWKAGGAASTNDDGAIDSEVSANTTAGFSIVSYTGTGSATTVGHGLSQTPELILIKNRPDADDWIVYSETVGNTSGLLLSFTNAPDDDIGYFNDTSPTSSVFTVGTQNRTNGSTNAMVAYCFHSIENYSKVGSYTANNSADGVFLYCGFSPAYFLVKSTTAGTDWIMFDNKRNTYNVVNNRLEPNTNAAEDQDANDVLDFVSNGIKIRGNGGGLNYSTRTQIYLAFAETPFKTANAR